MAKRSRSAAKNDPAVSNFRQGVGMVAAHPIFGRLLEYVSLYRGDYKHCPEDGWAVAQSSGAIYVNNKRLGDPDEWAYVIAHCLLHFGLNHFQSREFQNEWNVACDAFVAKFLMDIKFGRAPDEMRGHFVLGAQDEERLYEKICREGASQDIKERGVAGPFAADMNLTGATKTYLGRPVDWQEVFAGGLASAAASAVNVAAGLEPFVGSKSSLMNRTPAQRARSWFISSYPLLGAIAAAFDLIEDPNICNRMGVSIAAVHAEQREIYINPSAGLSEPNCRFVMAHEFMHVGLQHEQRRKGRDGYLWNVACDYVINGWLVEMEIGEIPAQGLLHDRELRGLSAEEIYDRITTDLRRARKLRTLRGNLEEGDMLKGPIPEWWCHTDGMSLDDFYKRALAQGLDCHVQMNRGLLPSGLIEEINALVQPPIPWDVELARWFDHYFPPLQKRRSYAQQSRRQSSTPDIPRPKYVPAECDDARTFGVVLDTSGSMDRTLLAKALGSIASYSASREVPYARVVFCDALAYDQGYMSPDDIAGRVKVRGRGGTILQPAINLLQTAPDFPKTGPILIITDGFCEPNLMVRRDHAYLLPSDSRLPFSPKGKVFAIS
jgi:predicted metal-dependent peptidase